MLVYATLCVCVCVCVCVYRWAKSKREAGQPVGFSSGDETPTTEGECLYPSLSDEGKERVVVVSIVEPH